MTFQRAKTFTQQWDGREVTSPVGQIFFSTFFLFYSNSYYRYSWCFRRMWQVCQRACFPAPASSVFICFTFSFSLSLIWCQVGSGRKTQTEASELLWCRRFVGSEPTGSIWGPGNEALCSEVKMKKRKNTNPPSQVTLKRQLCQASKQHFDSAGKWKGEKLLFVKRWKHIYHNRTAEQAAFQRRLVG